MRSVTYKSVLDRIGSYLTEADGLSVDDAQLVAPKINLFVRLAWELYWWPDCMAMEKRTFRPAWDAVTAFAAGDERFYPTVGTGNYATDTGAYYQALQPSTNQVPATLTNGAYVENGAYWALCQENYSADLWQANTDYGVNNDGSGLAYQVQNPADGRYYQCVTAHNSGSSFDAANWGVLTPFVRSIDLDPGATSNQGLTATPIGEVRFIWNRNPELNRYAQPMKFRLRNGYLQVLGTETVVWVEFRQRPSSYVNNVLDDTLGYAAGWQFYDPETGENWLTLNAINAGDTPTLAPASFQKLPFPYFLAEYVAQSAAGALTNKEDMATANQPQNFSITLTAGYPLLLLELDKLERQQGQTRQLNVASGRNSRGGWWYRS